tara:strand:- start:8493 stop:9419 length:927 start_codon:yes stop_codon:yes gene_type:complete
MKYLITIFIFSIVLFLYLHIQYHLKTSGDLEIYTIEQPSKEKLEEICDLRQPVIVDYKIDNIIENCNLSTLDDNYGAFDIQLRNVKNTDSDIEMHLPFLFKEAIKLFQTDVDKKYVTENNNDFMAETGVIKHYKYNDIFLRPPMVSKCIYDIWSGSVGACTPLRYHLNYRNYLYVTQGKIKIKLIPPNYSRYLDIQKDYENGEYRSLMNPWNIQVEHRAEFNKVKVLDLELTTGMLLYIPAYWNYSICYEEISSISVFQYRTYMNTIAVLPTLVIGLLQKHNVKRKNVKNVVINKKTEEEPKPEIKIE